MQIRVLELFSGMGGMHFAADEVLSDYEVVAAIDISEVPNKGKFICKIFLEA